MFKPLAQYDFIAVTLFESKYNNLVRRFRNLLCENPPNWNISTWKVIVEPLNVKSIIHNRQTLSGGTNRHFVIWPIAANKTIFLSNKADGSKSLIYPLELSNDYISIRTSTEKKHFAFNEFECKMSVTTRLIQAYLDSDRWVFWEKGDILSFEKAEYYLKRRIKDRLNYEIINEYLEVNGWFLNEEHVWHSSTATYFIEQNEKKINKW